MAADTACTASVTDDVLREIGEQVSHTMRKKLPRLGGTAFDIARGVEMYRGHLGISIPSSQMNLKDAASKAPNEVGVYVLKLDGTPIYVGRAIEDRPDQSTKGLRKRLQEHARGASTSSNDIRENRENLTVEIHQTGSIEAAKSLEAKKIDECKTEKDNGGWNKRVERSLSPVPDSARRTVSAVAAGIMSDMVVFAVGGAAMEIREAWQNPDDMPLLDRCKRLIQAIWQRFMSALKDRSLRELGSEAIAAAASVLTAPLRLATAAVEKIVEVLRRLWMDFVAGRLKTPADMVTAALKAVFAVASVGVALAVEAELTPLFAGIPFGDILAALCAAVVAGVMIVVGNRAIESVVLSLLRIFEGADAAKRRRQEIEALCAKVLPQLVADRERLQSMTDYHIAGRQALFNRTFADLRAARDVNDIDGFLAELCRLNEAYGAVLPWCDFYEADRAMLDPEPVNLRPAAAHRE